MGKWGLLLWSRSWVWPQAPASNAHHTNGRHRLFAPTHNYAMYIKLAVRTLEMYHTPGTYDCYLQPWIYPPASFSLRCYEDKIDNSKTSNIILLMVCNGKWEIPSWAVGCFCCRNPDNSQETAKKGVTWLAHPPTCRTNVNTWWGYSLTASHDMKSCLTKNVAPLSFQF